MKDRITLLVCANADGSEKVELMIIGTAKKPRPFKQKSGEELGFDYYANKKAWMTTDLFFKWLDRFNLLIGSTPGRKVVLLLENCGAHGTVANLPSFSNVQIIFLPPNTTSKFQPMDAGIITATKKRYRQKQMERAIDRADENIKDVYKVDILTAMKWIKFIWTELPDSIISDCWRHTGLVKTGDSVDLEVEEMEIEMELTSNLEAPVPAGFRVSVKSLLNPEGVDFFLQQDDGSTIVKYLLSSIVGDTSSEAEASEGNAEVFPLPSAPQQLKALALTKRILEAHGLDSSTV